MRRSLAVLLTALTLAVASAGALAAPAPAPPPGSPSAAAPAPRLFADLPPDHPAAPAVGALFLAGVVQGDDQSRFRPEDPVTRAEFVKMVLGARGVAVDGACRAKFPDVPCAAWYGPYVDAAHRLALVEGRGASRFEPQAPVTRQEAFVVMVRALGKWYEIRRIPWSAWAHKLAPFQDAGLVADWAERSAAYLVGQGILATGPGQTAHLRPAAPATRAEIAVLLQRALLPALLNRQVVQVDGAHIRYARALDMQATKYATGEDGVGTVTYTSLTVRVGVVAVDPVVIPLGSLLYVPGYGYAVAADVGGAIKGNKIDLYTEDYTEAALRFGTRPVRVYLLD